VFDYERILLWVRAHRGRGRRVKAARVQFGSSWLIGNQNGNLNQSKVRGFRQKQETLTQKVGKTCIECKKGVEPGGLSVTGGYEVGDGEPNRAPHPGRVASLSQKEQSPLKRNLGSKKRHPSLGQ